MPAGPGWERLQPALDQLPVFTVANEEGQPLQYEVDGKPVAIFYSDVEAAKQELVAAREQYPSLGCDLIPIGLGGVYKLCCEDKAVLVPGAAELTAAGAPAGVSAMGLPLPFFACMEMSQEDSTGRPVLPLFVSHADCSAAVAQASKQDLEEGDAPLEIVGLSLPSVVERLATVAEGAPAFKFIAPRSSAKYIEAYLDP